MYHIIPDIHGQADKLDMLLSQLGWRRASSGWLGPEPERRILFLGDFIDRGPENARVLSTVRSLLDSGKADAIMGNHEFNAIHFHTNGADGKPLRQHSGKNKKQHETFLREFPIGAPRTREVVGWMMTLPLYLELEGLRAVHACWHAPAIDRISAALPDARLDRRMMRQRNWKGSDLWDALQQVTSGIEEALPDGYSFLDKDGYERRRIRVAWWLGRAESWRDIARSVPDHANLPTTPLPERVAGYRYQDPVQVFFGHYWMTGEPVVEAPHALCLDYSAGKDGPLLAYDFRPGEREIRRDRILFGAV